MAATQLFTVGYEQRTVDGLLEALVEAGVKRVVDVRELPLSRRRGFSKTKLGAALETAGIEYLHYRAAGNPYRAQRQDVVKCLRLYRGHLDEHPEVVDEVARLASETRVALLCVEHRAQCCHRSVLVDGLVRRGHPVTVTHL